MKYLPFIMKEADGICKRKLQKNAVKPKEEQNAERMDMAGQFFEAGQGNGTGIVRGRRHGENANGQCCGKANTSIRVWIFSGGGCLLDEKMRMILIFPRKALDMRLNTAYNGASERWESRKESESFSLLNQKAIKGGNQYEKVGLPGMRVCA